jgi:hypothetical protein
MKHVLFAEFSNREEADAAIHDLVRAGVRQSRCAIEVHDRPPASQSLAITQTDSRHGFILGVTLAVSIGVIFGGILGAVGVVPVEWYYAAMFGGLLGIPVGLLGGGLSGSINPDQKLDKLERHAERTGGVVATVEVEGRAREDVVARVFAEHGAFQVEKRTV